MPPRQLSTLTDEMAHTTFFPALLLHACYDALTTSPLWVRLVHPLRAGSAKDKPN